MSAFRAYIFWDRSSIFLVLCRGVHLGLVEDLQSGRLTVVSGFLLISLGCCDRELAQAREVRMLTRRHWQLRGRSEAAIVSIC